MSTNSQEAPRPLPDRPNLRHLKNQAKDLLKAGKADSLTDAQFKIARLYGFSSWPSSRPTLILYSRSAHPRRSINSSKPSTPTTSSV